jgi:hypothetical protein
MINSVGCVVVFPVKNDAYTFECYTLEPEDADKLRKIFEEKVVLPDGQLVTSEYVKTILEE